MDIFVSAVLGELTSRSISFFISKISRATTKVQLDVEESLHRSLLRAQAIVEEATGRRITNRAMLQQLDMLRDAMYKGSYRLDTFRHASSSSSSDDEEEIVARGDRAAVTTVSFSSLSKLCSLKGICRRRSSGRKTRVVSEEQLQDGLDNLAAMIGGMEELVLFLTSYPRLYRQPYHMHLLLGNCMFGRQMEAELVVSFLLLRAPQRNNDGEEELPVLPIVGPGKVGKSTLVAHVCSDERVRGHFSEILLFNCHDVKSEKLSYPLVEGCAKKFQNPTSKNQDGSRRMLAVVEVAGDGGDDDFSDGEWARLYALCKQHMKSGSKIIITSRSDKITRFATSSRALTLKYLSDEAYWYFFKTLAFGSTDPMATHPSFARLAMEIARTMKPCLLGAAGIVYLLRDNFDARFWGMVAAFLRGFLKWHFSNFAEHPFDTLNRNRRARLPRMASSSEEIVVHRNYECSSSSEEEVVTTLESVMYGSSRPCGRFEALVWRSQIPPYYGYFYTCEIRDRGTNAPKRKRSMRNGGAIS